VERLFVKRAATCRIQQLARIAATYPSWSGSYGADGEPPGATSDEWIPLIDEDY